MIIRIDIRASGDLFDYDVLEDSAVLFGDGGLRGVLPCLAAALDGLPPQARAAEIALDGVVSGTYPLDVLASNAAQVAEHAANTTEAVQEALRG